MLLLNTDEDDPEIELGLSVVLSEDTEIVAQLFFLELTIAEDPDDTGAGEEFISTSASGSGSVNLDYGGDTEVPLLDVFDLDVAFDFTAAVNIDLLVTAELGDNRNLPSMSTNLVVDWDFSLSDPDGGGLHLVEFRDITLDLGGFLSGPVGEILEGLDRFIDPIRPVLDFLFDEVPLISQMTQLFGLGPFRYIDGIELLGEGAESVVTFFEVINAIAGALDTIQSVGGEVLVNFGDFTLYSDTSLNGGDPGFLFDPDEDLSADDGTFDESDTFDEDKPDEFDRLEDSGDLGIRGLSFPLIHNPAQIVNLLFGQPVDLVTWDVPRLEASFEYAQLFGPILPPFPIFARIAGSFGVFADLFVGFDTRGLQNGNFINGLYFGDHSPTTAAGRDVPELGFTMQFTAGAELNLSLFGIGSVRAGVEGGIRADITADWNDPNDDGKFYLDEVLMQASRGPECIFDLDGALTAFLRAYVKNYIKVFGKNILPGHSHDPGCRATQNAG